MKIAKTVDPQQVVIIEKTSNNPDNIQFNKTNTGDWLDIRANDWIGVTSKDTYLDAYDSSTYKNSYIWMTLNYYGLSTAMIGAEDIQLIADKKVEITASDGDITIDSSDDIKLSGTNLTFNGSPITTDPAGSDGEIQFNNSGAFGADSDFTWNSGSNVLSVSEGYITVGSPGVSYVPTSAPFSVAATNSNWYLNTFKIESNNVTWQYWIDDTGAGSGAGSGGSGYGIGNGALVIDSGNALGAFVSFAQGGFAVNHGYTAKISSGMSVKQEPSTNLPFTIFRARSSNTYDMTQWQAANGSVLAGVNSEGAIQGFHKSGAGVTNLADGDFSNTPANGTMGVAHNTTTGNSYWCCRANGTWKAVQIT